MPEPAGNEIVFLGTGGARVVVFKQVRASGGWWLRLDGTSLLVDPGPGALTQCFHASVGLDPTRLHGIFLSHRHLDHAADANTMIEAMTEAGLKRRGVLLAPADALDDDPVVMRYVRSYLTMVHVLEPGGRVALGEVEVAVGPRLVHSAENYAYFFQGRARRIAFLPDTRFFPALEAGLAGDLLIVNVVLHEARDLDHLCVADVRRILAGNRPKAAILTHFGMTMIRARPWEIAARLSDELGLPVVAAHDGCTTTSTASRRSPWRGGRATRPMPLETPGEFTAEARRAQRALEKSVWRFGRSAVRPFLVGRRAVSAISVRSVVSPSVSR